MKPEPDPRVLFLKTYKPQMFIIDFQLMNIIFINNNVYRGQFAGRVPHGRGVMKYSDNSLYEGNWSHGK